MAQQWLEICFPLHVDAAVVIVLMVCLQSAFVQQGWDTVELEDLTPASVLAVPLTDLREAGLSTRKVLLPIPECMHHVCIATLLGFSAVCREMSN